MTPRARGRLIIIGGHEDKNGDSDILKEVCRDAMNGSGSLVVITAASHEPKEQAEEYQKVFRDLGVSQVEWLDIRERKDAEDQEALKKLESAAVVFFTGGDQLRITSQIGDTLLYQRMVKMLESGITIAGTSAGAAAMPETMIVSGPGEASNGMSALAMAPGLGFLQDIVVDSHFAERGRISRLLSAVVQNPRNLGVGIDENTAILTNEPGSFRVIGSGAAYVVDGSDIEYSSLSDEKAEGVISIFGVKLHVLAQGDSFDLTKRQPVRSKEAQEELSKEIE